MRKIIVAVLALGLFSLASCGSVEAGTVVDKEFTAAYTEQVEQDVTEEECEWDTDRVKVGTKTTTKKSWECEDVVTGTELVDVHHEDKFELILEDEDGDTGTVEVSQDVYDSTSIGDWYGEK